VKELFIRVSTALVSLVFFLGAYFFSKNIFSLILFLVGAIIIFFEWPKVAKKNKYLWFLIPVYPLFPVFSLVYLNHFYRHIDILIPLYPFFISWAADTGGYFAGNLWGKHKLFPKISPKKTWEGLFGSLVLVLVVNVLVVSWFLFTGGPDFEIFGILNCPACLVVYSMILTVAAVGGDLFESFLKRKAGLKDTGAILPGHGGLLDRFDSVFFVGLVVFLSLYNL